MASPDQSPYDPELNAVLRSFPPEVLIPFDYSNLAARREAMNLTPDQITAAFPKLQHSERVIHTSDGLELPVSIFSLKDSDSKSRPGVYYIHGGGFVAGSRCIGLDLVIPLIIEHNAVVLTIDYGLAPENKSDHMNDEVFEGLQWVFRQSSELLIDPKKIIVFGGSSGGTLAAGLVLRWRDQLREMHRNSENDERQDILAQVLIYPSLDDRSQTPSSRQFVDSTWSPASSEFSWEAYTGLSLAARQQADRDGKSVLGAYAVPARVTDLSDLPKTYITVGSADILRDEIVEYASRIRDQGGDCELHIWPGAWHGFDSMAPGTKLSKEAIAARGLWMKALLEGSAIKA